MKLILSYELTFILVLAAIIQKAGMTISFGEIISQQGFNGAFAGSISGIILFIVMIFCIQAKLALVPFDMPEAETEIAGGIMIEFSGTTYAMIKLAKYIMFFILPAFLIGLLWGGLNFQGINILWSVLKILFVVLLLTLIRNTNPRVKIKQAIRYFLVWMNLLAIIAIVLSYFGF